MQNQGQQQTGTRNETFDVISILYHALEGAEKCSEYLRDAQDGQIKDFIQQAQQVQRQLADQGKQVLQQCLQKDTGGQSAFGWGQSQSSGQSGSQSGTFGDAASQNQRNFADQNSPAGGSGGGRTY